MFQKKTLLIALATMSVFTFAHAQEEGGPPPPDSGVQGVATPTGGGGGQRGMRGPGGPGGMGGPMMLMSPEVQKELNLTSDQISKIKALMPKRGQGGPMGGGQGGPQGFGPGGPGGPEGGSGGPRGRGPEGFGGPGGPEGGPGGPGGPGRGPNEMDQKLKTVLTEQQFTRMKQLRLQMEGPGAVLHPEIAKELGLSESQRTQIEALHPQGMGGRRGGRGGPGGPGGPGGFGEQGGPGGPGGGPGDGGTPPPNFNGGGMPPMQGEGGPGGPGGRMSKEMRDKQDAKILAVLTPAQKLKWQSMLGKPFHFSPRPPMGPGEPR